MVTRARFRPALLALLATLGGCDLGSATIPRTDPMLVIHAVLNPSDRQQFVLVEESLTGKQTVVSDGSYNPANPIVTGNGVPVTGALVELKDPDGLLMMGTEVKINGAPTGIYSINLNAYTDAGKPMQIKLGRRYELTVTAQGMTASGSTLVPLGTLPVGVPIVAFNRDHQSINLPIKDVALARAYWVRVEAPVSPFSVFTLDQEVAISGDARNVFTQDLLRVFFPGFLQTLTVAAVDSNLYDYYRSGNDPFSGRGLINRIEGGLGVFGAAVVVEKRQIDVTQDPTGDPIEATYTARSGLASSDLPHTMRLYLEALAPTADSRDRISGSYIKGPPFFPVRGAVLGTRRGTALDLQILETQATASINAVFKATISGDTLRGTYNGSATTIYVKAGK